jgi:diguanylate cyclase (GGDEF)-like protein
VRGSAHREDSGNTDPDLAAPESEHPRQVISRLTRSRLTCSTFGVLGAVLVGSVWAQHNTFGSPMTCAVFIAVQATAWALSSVLQPSDDHQVWQFDEVLFVVAAFLLPPAGVLLVFLVGTAAGQVINRDPPRVACFNGGQMTLAAAAGLLLAGLVRPLDQAVMTRSVLAAFLAGAAFIVSNNLSNAAYCRVVDRQPFFTTVVESLRFNLRRAAFVIPVAALAGVAAASTASGVALLGLLPIAGMLYAMGEHLRARRDRERTQGLFESSIEIHGSVRVGEVELAIRDAAMRLLRCREAEILGRSPIDGEWGAQLAVNGSTEMWVVVRSPITAQPLTDEALRLLDALVAIGSSALENARLVAEIERQGLHDALTGLPNHVLFEDRVAQAVTVARRNRERFAVMMLDLDAFKKVNDSLGHSTGNELLKVIGDRLSSSARDIDTVARLGSDHFTLLLPGVGNAETASVIAEKLLGSVRRPIALGGHELFMTATAGISFFPEDGTKAEHLLRNADSAMHRAKEHGRDRFEAYAVGMNDLAQLRLVRESELHNAIERDELRLRYQPQVDLRSGRIVGVEALVRWEHPLLGLIGPHEFVPLAEESGLIVAVDTWVLEEASRQAKRWIDEGLPPVRMAVNISGRHFHSSERLVDVVERVLGLTGLPADLLELEVTEGIAVGEEEVTARALQQIRDLGVKLAIDDFGTGYSMLGRLRSFPIDRLKIDRSFVSEIQSHHVDAPIVSAMIAMARSLHIECVAEGVETLEQQIFLRNRLCDQAQGFLYSHPVEPDDIVRLLCTPSVGYNLAAVS